MKRKVDSFFVGWPNTEFVTHWHVHTYTHTHNKTSTSTLTNWPGRRITNLNGFLSRNVERSFVFVSAFGFLHCVRSIGVCRHFFLLLADIHFVHSDNYPSCYNNSDQVNDVGENTYYLVLPTSPSRSGKVQDPQNNGDGNIYVKLQFSQTYNLFRVILLMSETQPPRETVERSDHTKQCMNKTVASHEHVCDVCDMILWNIQVKCRTYR